MDDQRDYAEENYNRNFRDEEDTYIESAECWARNMSDSELLSEFDRLCNEESNAYEKIDQLRHELSQWEASVVITQANRAAVEEKIDQRGLFSYETPEGPERYMCGTDLW